MSGKRQHFTPRFLQRGFTSHTSGNEAFTWVHRKGVPPFNANITKVGVEGAFYTDQGDSLVDDLITDAEGAFGNLVGSLRTGPCGAVSDPQLPILIAHLEVRTRHLRQGFLQMGEYLMSQFASFMADEDAFIALLERKILGNPSWVRKICSEEVAKRGLPLDICEPLMEVIPRAIPMWRAKLKLALPYFVAGFRAGLPQRLCDAIKSGHIKALKGSISPQTKAKRYEGLSYAVVDVPKASLILGDSPIIFHVDGARTYKTLLERSDVLRAVFLPLCPQRVLVGALSQPTAVPPDLTRTIARCSLEHFIAHSCSDVNNLLKDQIGEEAYLLSKSQIEKMVSESFDEWTGCP